MFWRSLSVRSRGRLGLPGLLCGGDWMTRASSIWSEGGERERGEVGVRESGDV